MHIPSFAGIIAGTVVGRHYRRSTQHSQPYSDAPENFAQREYETENNQRAKRSIPYVLLISVAVFIMLFLFIYNYFYTPVDSALDQWIGWHYIISSSGG